jgi:superfamily II DNA or RNA helicase
MNKPNVDTVLRGLKDFQRDTVEYVYQRLFLDADGQRRFLIADEVGLGKTLVARGLIAKAIDNLWDKADRIDVVYICSNASIARQNINRLNVTGEESFEIASRITLLPVKIRDLKHQKLKWMSVR